MIGTRVLPPVLILLLGSLALPAPSAGAAEETRLPAPDYSSPASWAAYPGRESHAGDVPAGVEKSGSPDVPVFFIHPTTYLVRKIDNAAFDDASAGSRVDNAVLRFQASVFNGCCRIYAPRYRQASLGAITSNSPEGYAAADLAYGDVARAFDAFLRANPQGPFIIASHSQGSIHALRLLQERIIGAPLQRRLVAAYAIGLSLPKEIGTLLPICNSADATGCVLTWNSVRRGHEDRRRKNDAVIWWQGKYQSIGGRPLVCVNPLTWRQDDSAPADANLGAVHGQGIGRPIPAPIAGLTGAWCEEGLLGVDIPFKWRRYFHDILTLVGIYHDFDYGLFYMNIRDNVARRIQAWRRSAGKH